MDTHRDFAARLSATVSYVLRWISLSALLCMAVGDFFEGVMTTGTLRNAIDEEVQANIVAAGYGR